MLYSKIAGLFVNHEFTKLEVDHPLVLNLSLLFGFTCLTLITLKKKNEDRPFSLLQTNQRKGLAIILIILYYLSIHTIKKRGDLPLFEDAGFVGVAIFLILYGLGISISIEKKGIQDFFSKRLPRFFLPVLFSMTLEVLLNHVLLHRKNNRFINFGRIFIALGKLDRNMVKLALF